MNFMNNKENQEFFTAFLSILLFFRIRGHISTIYNSRNQKILLEL